MLELLGLLTGALFAALISLFYLWFTDNYRVRVTVDRIAPPAPIASVEAPHAE